MAMIQNSAKTVEPIQPGGNVKALNDKYAMDQRDAQSRVDRVKALTDETKKTGMNFAAGSQAYKDWIGREAESNKLIAKGGAEKPDDLAYAKAGLNDVADTIHAQAPEKQNYYEGLAASQVRNQLQSGRGQNAANANARGMLRSGGKQSTDYGLMREANSRFADAAQKIPQIIKDQESSVRDQSNALAAKDAGLAPQLGSSALSGMASDLSNYVNNLSIQNSVLSGLGQGVGSAAGIGLANYRDSLLRPKK